MKNLVVFFVFLLSALTATAQVSSSFFEGKDAFKSFPALKQSGFHLLAAKKMQQAPVEELLKEDRENEGMDIPFRFGYGFDVNYTLKDGIWTVLGEERVWNLKIASSGAYSLNFIFDEFQLSPGAQLYIFNTEGSMVYGPVTAEQNIEDGTFLTDLVAGDEVVIQLIEPVDSKKKSTLRISRVVHAYRNLFSSSSETGLRAATLSCHNDVACYSAWSNESDAVALVLLNGGTALCTGSLLNNTAQDYRPFVLTAFHCIDTDTELNLDECPDRVLNNREITTAENWAFRFRYKKSSCGGTTNGWITYNRANFRAAWADTDFALMELLYPVNTDQITFLGWDRSGNVSSSGTGIHHPEGDLMKISFDNHSLVSNTDPINWGHGSILCNTSPANSHWIVGFDNGTTEGGSSGSPLFDSNKRVVGQLHGGGAGCAPITKYYGQFHRSWNGGGTNATRLSNWLDPNNTGAMTTNTIRNPSITGPENPYSFGSATYSVANVPAGTSVTWSGSSNITIISGQGTNSVTIRICGDTHAFLYATLSGTSNVVINKTITVNNGTLTIESHLDRVYLSFNHPYATCYDWALEDNMTSNIGSGTISCTPNAGMTVSFLNGATSGYITVKPRTSSCSSAPSTNEFISLWKPEIDVSNSSLNPDYGSPFYACLASPAPNELPSAQYYWYFDNTLFTVTSSPEVQSYSWPCDGHWLKVKAVSGSHESPVGQTYFWGNCGISPSASPGISPWSAAYPNPAENELIIDRTANLQLQAAAKTAKPAEITVLLYATDGVNIVYQKSETTDSKQIRIDTSKLKNGLYFLNVVEGKEITSKQKIIVKH